MAVRCQSGQSELRFCGLQYSVWTDELIRLYGLRPSGRADI